MSRILWCFWIAAFTAAAGMLSSRAYRAAMTKHWPVTEGVVTAFHQTPSYRYEIDGGTHVSDVVSCNQFFNQTLAARHSSKYAVRYPLNGTVKVHYDPDDPDLAVLETDFDSSILNVIGGMLLLSALGVIGFWRGWRWPVRRRRRSFLGWGSRQTEHWGW